MTTKSDALIESLDSKLSEHLSIDREEHKELFSALGSQAEVLARLDECTKNLKEVLDKPCPFHTDVCTNLSSLRASNNTHSWFIKALIGVTIIAVLGGAVTNVASCENVRQNISASAAERVR